MMDILFVTISWPQKEGNNLYSDLAKKFRDKGHNIYIACTAQKREGLETYHVKEDGISTLRIRTGNISKAGPLEKGISLLLLNRQFKKAINQYYRNETFDLILFNTPPITVSGLLKKLKEKYNSKLYLLLKDIWPQDIADLGVIKRGGIAWKYFRYHERKIYNIADYIGCMSPAGVSFMLDENPQLDPSKVEVCPNSVFVSDQNFDHNPNIRIKYGIPDDASVFLFSGNLGRGQGLDFLVNSIKKLNDYKKAFFLIGGAGTHFEKMEREFKKHKPDNAFLYSYLPERDFENLLGICDVGLILLDSSYNYPQFPSRLLAYLRARMAVLCAVNKETDIGNIVENADAGIQTIHGDIDSFLRAVKLLSEDKNKTSVMGENAFKLLKNKYTVQHSYDIIMSHFG